MNCGKCKHLASKSIVGRMNGVLVGCRFHRKEFGIIADLVKTKICVNFKERGK